MLFAKYPYTDMHEMNLDWILRIIKELDREVDEFVAFNKITFAGTWDGSAYPKWSIVDDGAGNGYLAIQAVPANVPLSNTDYWLPVSQYTALYNAFDARISALENMEPIFVRPEDYGAAADGATDDRKAIQDAIDSGKPVVFTAGKTYAFKVDNGRGFTIPSGASLNLNGATLKQLYNGDTSYNLLYMEGVQNVEIFGGTIYGDKDDNLTSTEWCYGIFGRNVAHIFIRDMVVKKCSGDGIEFGDVVCRDIHVDHVFCDNNGRNGLSITNADGVFISNSIFSNSSGHDPQEGVDLEANDANCVLKNIHVTDCSFENNVHAGLNVLSLANNDSVFISGCYADGAIMATIRGDNSSVIVTDCSIKAYAFVDYGTGWAYGVGSGIFAGCAEKSSMLFNNIVVDCTNHPVAVITYAEGATLPGRYHIKMKNIQAINGEVDRWILNRGNPTVDCEVEINAGNTSPVSATNDFITVLNGELGYKVKISGFYEFDQVSDGVLPAYGDIMIAKTSAGGNVTLMYQPCGYPVRIYNRGSESFGLVGGTFFDASGQSTQRIVIDSMRAVEVLYSAESDFFSYRFI